ncbi:MAG TPA: hypothetical protein VJ976_01835 [Ornithinimicrobium sp.]|uniref:Rv1678 family membrane protein n=1 Tax=Ornithinimicrobium sp. TaxID=1977084 RepID=UPI002B4A70EF|nr:hypothetical protein [Ornithinimicrobium sp.]HKJ11111.1 hypothetical protein [Ornithinimicrobium sp.]
MPSPASAVGWFLAPATDDAPRYHAVGATILRITVGLMWLYNVAWKRPPDFGEDSGSGLYGFTELAVEHPVFPPYSWVVEHIVLPFIQPFGWGVLVVETALAVLLLTGTYVRLAALLGIAQSLAIGLSVAYAPEEWPWAYWLMIAAHIALLVSSSGRVLAVDAVRARLSDGRVLATVWAGAALLTGVLVVIGSFADPLAARGYAFGSSDPSVSLGRYNVLGGVILLVLAVLLLLAARTTSGALGTVAVVLGVLAGLSLHAQLGFTDPLLGGNATAAAMYFSLALVAAYVSVLPSRGREAEKVSA